MADTIKHVSQQPNPGDIVHLYIFDASKIGGSIYHFTQGRYESTVLTFNGAAYQPIDLEAEGYEHTGRGALPQPKLRISNVNRVLHALVTSYDDLIGCEVTRLRTYRRFLDGEPDADPTQTFEPDVYEIARKSMHNKFVVEFELASAVDNEGRTLPGRQVLRDTCPARYRVWNGSAFIYTGATCPYNGTNYFKKDGTATTANLDDCGRRLSDCRARFGETAPLPYEGFPGVGRTRGG